jgi:hypothetical protein
MNDLRAENDRLRATVLRLERELAAAQQRIMAERRAAFDALLHLEEKTRRYRLALERVLELETELAEKD